MVAAALAQHTHAPNIVIIFEGGVIGSQLKNGMLPLSTQEWRGARKSMAMVSNLDIFLYQQRGFVDYGILGAAQVDMYGNINTTAIGDFRKPAVRLPGSGGANDIASLSTRVIIMCAHEKRRFVEKVDFVTSPGYLRGGSAREDAGLIFGGPYKVVTDLALMGFDKRTRRMKLEAVQSGVSVEQVTSNTGFDLEIAEDVAVIKPPTKEEIRLVRAIDPEGTLLGG